MDNQSLYSVLYTFLDWHPARIRTFSELIWSVVKVRTVRVKELALHVNSSGTLKAKVKKVSRLLLLQTINITVFGKIILQLLALSGKLTIAIDRTNWQFGAKNLNFFVAAVVYGNISIPFSWMILDKKGNSNTVERKKLIEQILAIIALENIEVILADREFIGEEWLEYLCNKKFPFAIRVKKNETIKHKNGRKIQLGKHFANIEVGTSKSIETALYNTKTPLKITCLQLEKEQLYQFRIY